MQPQYSYQPALFENKSMTAKFPSTRYQGSKAKLANWIWEQIKDISFITCLDAFGGTGSLAYRLKQAGKSVVYNDILRFNYYIGLALIENKNTLLNQKDVDFILAKHSHIDYPHFVQDTFSNIYFTDEENGWIDQVITNIQLLQNTYKSALAFFALAQSAIVKRPYNLFHRRNLYVRLAEVKRSFGNKTSWDRPFSGWFRDFVSEVNQAVFDNGQHNQALNCDVFSIPNNYDLIYIDPPYISKQGVGVDYRDFYHFLEGLTMYNEWEQHIDYKSKHLRLKRVPNIWTDKNRISTAFDKLFSHFQDSILVISYRSDGIPTQDELLGLLKKYKPNVELLRFGQYKYVLSTNKKSEELLFIAR